MKNRAADQLHPVTAEWASGLSEKNTAWVEAYGRDTSDFYQIHQYADAGPWNWPPAEPRYLSKPVILGEIGAANSGDPPNYLNPDAQAAVLREVLSDAAGRGYGAVLAWAATDGGPDNPLAGFAPDGSRFLRAAGEALRDTPSAVVCDVRIERSGARAVVTFRTDSPALGQAAWASQAWHRRYAARLPDVAARFEAFPGRSAAEPAPVTAHRIEIDSLDPTQHYVFAVRAALP